jgi:hypothetical protein
MARTYAEEKKELLHRAADIVDADPDALKVDLVHSTDGLDIHFKIPRAADKNDPHRQAYKDILHAASALITAGH